MVIHYIYSEQLISSTVLEYYVQAFKRRLFGPRYVWITHGWYPDRWWTQEVTNNTVNCTESQLEEFLVQGRVIALTHLTTPDDRNAMTDQGTVSRKGENIVTLSASNSTACAMLW